ncbi:MAG: translation initiation factor IF-3 [Chitinophagales bacterium]
MRRPNFRPRVKQEAQHKINDRIRAQQVRLTGDNVEPEIYSLEEALNLAGELELDLVEISPKASPPVCKILDYKKFLYEKKKKEKEIKAKTQKTVIKELRFGPNTDDHDFEFKAKHGEKFLEEGSKIKAYVHFKGRSIVFKDRGELLLLKLAKRLEDLGAPEQLPKLEGKRMIMVIGPKKKSKK